MADEPRNEADRHRFAIGEGEGTAVLMYREEPGRITFVHTEVPPQLQGQGMGSRLARVGLEYAREHHLLVRPRCPFVAAYLKRHPQFEELVDPVDRG